MQEPASLVEREFSRKEKELSPKNPAIRGLIEVEALIVNQHLLSVDEPSHSFSLVL